MKRSSKTNSFEAKAQSQSQGSANYFQILMIYREKDTLKKFVLCTEVESNLKINGPFRSYLVISRFEENHL